jgi:sugar/nucleoside kinase (ribokinase family)
VSADVVVAGHVCLDVTPQLGGPAPIEPGRLLAVGEAAFTVGGAVGNTGVALHRLGVPVRLVARIGGDLLGTAVEDALAADGLAADLVVAPAEATSYSIVISPPGVDRAFLHHSGANDFFSAGDVGDEVLAGARILHLGYPPLLRRLYVDGGRELALLFRRARAAGLATSLDMCVPDPASEAGLVDWRGLLARTLPQVDVFAPSLGELRFMLGRPDETTPSALADELLELGATVVALKLGDRGLHLRSSARIEGLCERLALDADDWRDRVLALPCFEPARVARTTGSGDATIAGLLAALLRGAGPEEAATAATAVGACSVESAEGARGIPPWPEIEARIGAGWGRI